MRTSTSRNLLKDSLIRDLGEVSTLDISRNTVKRSSQGVLRRGINHLRLNWGCIWGPSKKNNLGSLTFTGLEFILKVIDSVKGIVLWELTEELVVVVRSGSLLNDNLSLSRVELIKDKLVLLTELEVIEGLKGFVSDDNTGSRL